MKTPSPWTRSTLPSAAHSPWSATWNLKVACCSRRTWSVSDSEADAARGDVHQLDNQRAPQARNVDLYRQADGHPRVLASILAHRSGLLRLGKVRLRCARLHHLNIGASGGLPRLKLIRGKLMNMRSAVLRHRDHEIRHR